MMCPGGQRELTAGAKGTDTMAAEFRIGDIVELPHDPNTGYIVIIVRANGGLVLKRDFTDMYPVSVAPLDVPALRRINRVTEQELK